MKFSLLTTVSSAAIGAGLALSSITAAEAGQASYTVSSNNGAFVSLPGPASGTTFGTVASESSFGTVNLPFFVPGARQTLTSVAITLTGPVKATGSLTNQSGGTKASPFTVDFRAYMSLGSAKTTPSGFALLATKADPSQSYSAVKPGQVISNIVLTANFATASSKITSTSALAGFISSTGGDYSVDVLAAGQQRETGSGGQLKLLGSAVGTVEVTYNYTTSPQTTPAPEPASIALLGAGLGGVGVIRRRRKT